MLQRNQMPSPAETVYVSFFIPVSARRPLAKPISVHLGKHRLVRGLVCFIQFNLPVPPLLIDRTHFSLFAVNLPWFRARNSGQILTDCDFALISDCVLDFLSMCSVGIGFLRIVNSLLTRFGGKDWDSRPRKCFTSKVSSKNLTSSPLIQAMPAKKQ